MVSITNSEDIVANTMSVIDQDKVIDLKVSFFSKFDDINAIVRLPVETLNSLQQLAEHIHSDAIFRDLYNAMKFKSDLLYVDTQFETITTNKI